MKLGSLFSVAVEFSVALMYLLLLFKRFGNDKTSQRMGIRIVL